jgi:hypothetical protein
MILAHLPSGYLLGRLWLRRYPRQARVMGACLVGAIAPDLDLIWFYLIDDRAFHHHRYWVHIPGFWGLVALFALPLVWLFARGWFRPALAFLSAILLHLILDTLTGGILWAWPFSGHLYTLVTVPAAHANWVLSFLLHWTMLAELGIIMMALILYLRERKAIA